MKIDVIISADQISDELVKDKVVVVIDVLRATSVITTALSNGCKTVIPVLTVEEAFELKNKYEKGQCILGGERRAVKIDGFDFSNSPLEYTQEAVKNKTVILSTTNGTRAITKCKMANKIYIGAIINARATAKEIVNENKDIVLVNAGTNGQFSIDDFRCAGLIVDYILNNCDEVEATDVSLMAQYYYKSDKNNKLLMKARHYNVLLDLGLQEDIRYCFQEDIINKVYKCKIIGQEIIIS